VRGRGARHLLLRAAALAAFGALAVTASASAQQDTTADEILIRVRVERGPSRVMTAFARDSLVLLPVAGVLDLVGVSATPGRGRRGDVLTIGVGPQRAVLSLAEGRIVRDDSTLPLTAYEWLARDTSLYLAAGPLAWALGTHAGVSWSDLEVGLSRTDSLPVVVRAERDARRAALIEPGARPPAVAAPSAPQPLVDGGLLDWALTSSTTDLSRGWALQLGAGAEVAGGSLELSTLLQGSGDALSHQRGTWTRAWQDVGWLRQVRLGDLAVAGPDPRTVFGAIVTNAPFLRQAAFGSDLLAGGLPPGWEAEAYRFAQLVGYAPAGAEQAYRLAVPVSYGPNPTDLVFYGPHGEVARTSATFVIPAERLPAARFEYALGGGGCRDDLSCRAAGNADLRYGLTERVTAQGGVQVLSRAGAGTRAYPYALASVGLTRALGVTLQGALRGYARARIDLDPSPDFHFALDHGVYDTTGAGQYAGRLPGRTRSNADLFWRPRILAGALYFAGSLMRTTRDSTTADIGSVSASVTGLGARATVGVRRTALATRGFPATRLSGFDAAVQVTLAGPTRALRGLFVRGSLRTECPGEFTACSHELVQAGFSVGRLLWRVLRVDLGASWQKGWHRPGFDLSMQTTLPYLRATSHNLWTPTTRLSGAQVLEGSVRWDRSGRRVDLGNGRNLGRSGVAGVVFLDENGDGRQDGKEPGIPGSQVRVGSMVVRTDSLGRFRVFDLVPFERTVVEVDSLSFADPTWVAAEPRLAVTPAPNVFQQVPVPVLQGGEVSGRIAWEGHEHALGGLQVFFRDQTRGTEASVTTFSDGSFYAMSLRPGAYWVYVDQDQVRQLHLRSQAIGIAVGDGEGRVVEGVTLTVEPAGQR
jgi:hypothetical protein